ncbi:MAG: hypothetical protein A3J79_03730 [Elusimicrobia bacterium RIFOXYB2_FULL_62_6]|nr:MAG: hypothetical protein A3J79_03730 [Elusimicrobia bacterium RIFOXYB2_FULL_62_6]
MRFILTPIAAQLPVPLQDSSWRDSEADCRSRLFIVLVHWESVIAPKQGPENKRTNMAAEGIKFFIRFIFQVINNKIVYPVDLYRARA